MRCRSSVLVNVVGVHRECQVLVETKGYEQFLVRLTLLNHQSYPPRRFL
jgi:hypothetical protein